MVRGTSWHAQEDPPLSATEDLLEVGCVSDERDGTRDIGVGGERFITGRVHVASLECAGRVTLPKKS